MKYSKVVAEAREAAVFTCGSIVVYEDLTSRWWNKTPRYNWCTEICFNSVVEDGTYPVIKLLLILSTGTVAQ